MPPPPALNILCVMRIPPDPNGHGGSQRAWWLLQALRALGSVHFVLLSRKSDQDCATVPLTPLTPLCASVTAIDIPQWMPIQQSRMPHRRLSADWANLARMRSHEAPAFTPATLRAIADRLPTRGPDLLFAGRLPCAIAMDDLIAHGALTPRAKIADFDDVMSRFRASQRQYLGLQRRFLAGIDTHLIRAGEARIATGWDAVSVCADDDAAYLRHTYPTAHIAKVVNVVSRPALPARTAAPIRLLFVGNLSFYPNVQGLELFLAEAWPAIRAAAPTIQLAIVGLHPNAQVQSLAAAAGAELHPNVPDVAPFYQQADIVISPVLVGSGTRIKILEALAYARPVVATHAAAQGLDVQDNTHLILTAAIADFAPAILSLATDPARRQRLAHAGRALVQRAYGVQSLQAALTAMMPPALRPPARTQALEHV